MHTVRDNSRNLLYSTIQCSGVLHFKNHRVCNSHTVHTVHTVHNSRNFSPGCAPEWLLPRRLGISVSRTIIPNILIIIPNLLCLNIFYYYSESFPIFCFWTFFIVIPILFMSEYFALLSYRHLRDSGLLFQEFWIFVKILCPTCNKIVIKIFVKCTLCSLGRLSRIF